MDATGWAILGFIVSCILLASLVVWCACRVGAQSEAQFSASEEAHLAAATERAYRIMREEGK